MHPASSRLDLRQVLYFLTVADELNFSRAAARLHISAPALSQQIKALERHLSVQLLVRDSRRVGLTAAGEAFARSGEQLLRDGESAVQKARTAGGVIGGQLLVASLHDAESAFEPFLSEFHAAYPGISLKVNTARHAELIAALRNRSADAALTWSFLLERGTDVEGLQWTSVAPTEVFAAVSPSHPLAELDCIPRGKRLRDTGALMFERSYSPITFDYALEELYGADAVEPPVQEVSITVRAQETMAKGIADSQLLTPLSRPVADLFRQSCAIRPFEPPWMIDGCVVWRDDNSSAALVAFMAACAARGVRPRSGRGQQSQPR